MINETKFPQTFRITATLDAPEGATKEDVIIVLKSAIRALTIEKVEKIEK